MHIFRSYTFYTFSIRYSVAVDLVSQKISYFDERSIAQKSGRRSLLDDYLLNPRLDLADVVGMACDVLLVGVDTVCITWTQYIMHLKSKITLA